MLEEKIDYIRAELFKDTGLVLVDTDNNHKKPDYPFYSYKITSFILDNNQAGAVHIEELEDKALQTMQLDSKLIISFNAYSDKITEAYSKALKAWEFFKFRGKEKLREENIIVVTTNNIQDRTIHIVDEYEYRYGFDVELRLLHDINREVDIIETYEIKEEEINQ